MTSLRLYKREKLCSLTAIELLFAKKDSMSSSSYPIRAVWRINPHRKNNHPQFLISVPKKKLKHAVDRVKMRRRIREAYRLNRHNLQTPENTAIDIAFIYQNNNLTDFASIEHSMIKLLGKISGTVQTQKNEGNETGV